MPLSVAIPANDTARRGFVGVGVDDGQSPDAQTRYRVAPHIGSKASRVWNVIEIGWRKINALNEIRLPARVRSDPRNGKMVATIAFLVSRLDVISLPRNQRAQCRALARVFIPLIPVGPVTTASDGGNLRRRGRVRRGTHQQCAVVIRGDIECVIAREGRNDVTTHH